MKLCAICSKRITYTFWICAACEVEYGFAGKSYSEWPEWVKEMVRTSRKETRASRKEIPFSHLENSGFDPFEYFTKD